MWVATIALAKTRVRRMGSASRDSRGALALTESAVRIRALGDGAASRLWRLDHDELAQVAEGKTAPGNAEKLAP